MPKKFDTLKFKIDRYDLFGLEYQGCTFFINDKEIMEIAKQAETKLIASNPKYTGEAQEYIYVFAEEAYESLIESENSNGEDDAYLLCCTCGCTGCGSLKIKVLKTDDAIIWNNFRGIYEEDLGLCFRFSPREYKQFTEELKARV